MDVLESPGLVIRNLAHTMAAEMGQWLRACDVTMSQ